MNETKKECCDACLLDSIGMCDNPACECHEATPNTMNETKKDRCNCTMFHIRPHALHGRGLPEATPNTSLEGKEPATEWRERFDKEFPLFTELDIGMVGTTLNILEPEDKAVVNTKKLAMQQHNNKLRYMKAFIASEIEQALAQGRGEGQAEERQFILNVLDGIDIADAQMGYSHTTKAIRFALKSRVLK